MKDAQSALIGAVPFTQYVTCATSSALRFSFYHNLSTKLDASKPFTYVTEFQMPLFLFFRFILFSNTLNPSPEIVSVARMR